MYVEHSQRTCPQIADPLRSVLKLQTCWFKAKIYNKSDSMTETDMAVRTLLWWLFPTGAGKDKWSPFP